MDPFILATRKSPLALAQAQLVSAYLNGKGLRCELLKLVTTGDQQAEWSLEAKGGKGLFTRELESALLEGRADAAVHSTKDLPGDLAAGLSVAGYLPREDPRDVLVLRSGIQAPKTLATGSPRRRFQATMLFPNLEFREIRGNVDTRLRKISEQHLADGTILAAAGLRRLGIAAWPGLEFHSLGMGSMVPAVGQGAIAVECRSADLGRFKGLFDPDTAKHIGFERAFQALLGAGCQTAFGACSAADTLYLFHEQTGLRSVPVSDEDFSQPQAAARRILGHLGLGPDHPANI